MLVSVLTLAAGLGSCGGSDTSETDVGGAADVAGPDATLPHSTAPDGSGDPGQDAGPSSDDVPPSVEDTPGGGGELDGGPADAVSGTSELGASDDAGAPRAAECSDLGATGDLVVHTTLGPVEGVTQDGASAWLGIPYVAPPVGDGRWAPPSAHGCYESVVAASGFGAVCPQIAPLTGAHEGEEDCLTLNVWAPSSASAESSLPVLFFLHGGGNVQGSSAVTLPGNQPTYSGRHIVGQEDVLVVTVNYRLGALGFLTLPELSAEAASGTSGNYGLLDQIAALEWVRDNIARFGGDPDRVLLFGESAGAVDTCALLASPLAAGLFHRALMQSGGCPAPDFAVAEEDHAALVDGGPCGDAEDRIACLRGLDSDAVLEAMPGSVNVGSLQLGKQSGSYGPVTDGWVLPLNPFDALAVGSHNAVPLVVGVNADEMVDLIGVKIDTAQQYENTVTLMFGLLGAEVLEAVLEAYPVDSHATPQDTLVQLLSDMRFVCPAREIARLAAVGQEEPVYRYFFTRRAETAQGDLPARHGVELLYVFRTLTDIPLYQPAAGDLGLADAMIRYWTRFAATGDPDGGDDPAWPVYDAATDPFLELAWPVTTGAGVHTERCDMWLELLESLTAE